MPRRIYWPELNRLFTQLHGFSDASERAIGAVVSARTVYEDDRIDVKMIASKTRVSLLKGKRFLVLN